MDSIFSGPVIDEPVLSIPAPLSTPTTPSGNTRSPQTLTPLQTPTGKNDRGPDLELPPIAPGTAAQLKSTDMRIQKSAWNSVVDTLCFAYLDMPGRMDNQRDYRSVGKRIVAQYPALARSGSNEWVSINILSLLFHRRHLTLISFHEHSLFAMLDQSFCPA